ncbi:DUF2243 domain-containing protein [Pedobacter sp. SYSU D00535]|uniref:DUF2243 domain-containing protein n=1 Tax=Pedobacter sp. SYSU D00535 TaxID=2810308 RepID=UPI001A97B5B5|nr:DUF2243 domain-containing protein [Pedobacter sp. SYSU D00535]
MKNASLSLLALLAGVPTYACTTCSRRLQQAIFNSSFLPNLFFMISPFLVLGLIVAMLAFVAGKRELSNKRDENMTIRTAPLIAATCTIGIGLGGFVDGIVFHQILQWHQMLSNSLPPVTLEAKNVNMFWDGIFHAFCFLATVIGIVLLWKIAKRQDTLISDRLFAGGLLLGWAIFNIVEGVADHYLLKLHNVREITEYVDGWNFGFLAFSILMLVVALLIIKKGRLRNSFK